MVENYFLLPNILVNYSLIYFVLYSPHSHYHGKDNLPDLLIPINLRLCHIVDFYSDLPNWKQKTDSQNTSLLEA